MSIRKIIHALVLTALLALVPGIYFFDKLSPDHELDKTLKEMGFLPVNPPSNLLGIGSLFHVDPKVKLFRTVCRADPAYVETIVVDSPGIKMLADVLERGTYALDLKLDLSAIGRGNAKAADEFSRKVKFTLSDVKLFELDLRNSRYIFDRDARGQILRAGGPGGRSSTPPATCARGRASCRPRRNIPSMPRRQPMP